MADEPADTLTPRDLIWGDVFHAVNLMRFGDYVQVGIIEGTQSLSYPLRPDQADEIADRLHQLAELARGQ